MQIKKNKSKQLRIDNDLFHVLSKVKLADEKWSATARRFLDSYVKAVYPDVVNEINRQYAMAENVLENNENEIAKEIIKGEK